MAEMRSCRSAKKNERAHQRNTARHEANKAMTQTEITGNPPGTGLKAYIEEACRRYPTIQESITACTVNCTTKGEAKRAVKQVLQSVF